MIGANERGWYAGVGAHTPRHSAGLSHRRLTAVRPAGSHIRGWLIALTAPQAARPFGAVGRFLCRDVPTWLSPTRKGGGCPPPHLQLTESRRMAGRMSANARLLTALVHANHFPLYSFRNAVGGRHPRELRCGAGFRGFGFAATAWRDFSRNYAKIQISG